MLTIFIAIPFIGAIGHFTTKIILTPKGNYPYKNFLKPIIPARSEGKPEAFVRHPRAAEAIVEVAKGYIKAWQSCRGII